MHKPENFRALAAMLRGREPLEIVEDAQNEDSPEADCARVALANDEMADEIGMFIREIRLFRARVEEAVEDSVDVIVGDIAAHVLARELEIAPADITKIVDRLICRFFDEEPLRIRVNPAEAARVQCAVPVVADDRLRPGDAIVELRNGAVDASLGVRIDAVLRGVA